MNKNIRRRALKETDNKTKKEKINAKYDKKIPENSKDMQIIDLGKGKRHAFHLSEIVLWLDEYNDLFSDFDPRLYSQKALSEDFLIEIKKASKDKLPRKMELRFLIPKNKREEKQERVIKKRLKEHFTKHLNLLKKDSHKIARRGAIFIAFGIIVMLLAAYVLFEYGEVTLFLSFLIILLEPAGWFMFWEGLDQIIFETGRLKSDIDFYYKMKYCRISFLSY